MDDQQAKSLLSLVADALDRIETATNANSDHIERQSSLLSTLVLTLKRADAQSANGRLQNQASMNRIDGELAQLLAIILDPKALSGAVPREVLDQARQIARKTSFALTGKDPAKDRRNPDDITLISVRVGGARKAWRLNKKHALALVSTLFGTLGWLAKWAHAWLSAKGH